MIAAAPIAAGSPAAGGTVAGVEARVEGRVLLLTSGGRQRWCPAGNTPLAAGQELIVIATRRGLTQLLTVTGTAQATGSAATATSVP